MTPDESDCLNRIKRGGASLCAQLKENGIQSGPAAELEESSLIELIMIDHGSHRRSTLKFPDFSLTKEQNSNIFNGLQPSVPTNLFILIDN